MLNYSSELNPTLLVLIWYDGNAIAFNLFSIGLEARGQVKIMRWRFLPPQNTI